VPFGARPGGGQREVEGFPPGVDQDQEVVIGQGHAVFGPVGVIAPVQVDGQGLDVRVAQAAPSIGVPVGANHCSPEASVPARKRLRRKTGWASRNAISRLVKSSSPVSALAQSAQVISLSWQ
jgi:hypothetical protein